MKNKIRERREWLGVSQVKLAALTGFLACSTISDFETGKRQPWPRARKALAQVLGMAENELFPELGNKDEQQ
jgi:transcriptional regulator with XRE-family HTH domain